MIIYNEQNDELLEGFEGTSFGRKVYGNDKEGK